MGDNGKREARVDRMSDVEVQHQANRRRFVARTEAGPAYVAYNMPDERTIELHHTIVPRSERGRGIGSQVISAAIAYAREHGLRVIPTCHFVRTWLEEHPEEQDVVK
jgi:predicted GNAT family acetyltransferase